MNLKQELRVTVEKLNVHKCDRCPRVFTDLGLKKHMEYHDEWFLSHIESVRVVLERVKIFECESCTRCFLSKREYMFHKLWHIQSNVLDDRKGKQSQLFCNPDIPKPYSCPDCDYKFVMESSLEIHSILHKPFPHICHCGIGYYQHRDLVSHKKLVHKVEQETAKPKINSVGSQNDSTDPKVVSVKKEKSKKLQKKPKIKIKLLNGKLRNVKWERKLFGNPDIEIKQTDTNKFECPVCKKLYNSKNNLFIHYRTHTGERPYSCDECGKSFTQSSALRAHKYIHESLGQRNYQCVFCDKTFGNPLQKERHEMIHGLKRYHCIVCDKRFHDPSAFARHKRVHTGEKRYKCPHCPKAFTDVSALKPHVLRHQNKKDFSCDTCQKKFYTKSDLNVHLKTHDSNYEVQYYYCDYCNKCCTSKYNLQTHIIVMHLYGHKCRGCHKKFKSLKKLKEHRKTHRQRKSSKITCSIKEEN